MKRNDYTNVSFGKKIVTKLLGVILMTIGIIPIMLSAITHTTIDIGGAILTIFIGGCAFVGNEIVQFAIDRSEDNEFSKYHHNKW